LSGKKYDGARPRISSGVFPRGAEVPSPADIHAAFADPDIKAVIPRGGTVTVDGGTRQILVTY
jgi:hypothetical protein